jgi:hypothetical protein
MRRFGAEEKSGIALAEADELPKLKEIDLGKVKSCLKSV